MNRSKLGDYARYFEKACNQSQNVRVGLASVVKPGRVNEHDCTSPKVERGRYLNLVGARLEAVPNDERSAAGKIDELGKDQYCANDGLP